MKVIYDYLPASPSDTDVTITSSSAATGFPVTNLKYPQPVRSWKSTVITESSVTYDFGANQTYDSLFINRFNFAAFTVQYSTAAAPTTWVDVEVNTGLTKDEIYDENYMHKWVDLTGLTYRYIKVLIPAQTPLFDILYFKIGNIYVGNMVEIWWPKPGFQISYVPKMNLREFYSGYVEKKRIGRTRRVFDYRVDKITTTEYNKIRITSENFILYMNWLSDEKQAFLVRFSKETIKRFDMHNINSSSYEMEEVV